MTFPQIKTAEAFMARNAEWIADGWNMAGNLPPEGVRVEVRHLLGTYRAEGITGVIEAGEWSCTEGFICPFTMQVWFDPTHWRTIVPSIGEAARG